MREKPFFRAATPAKIPTLNPTSPTMAFKSPPPRRSTMRSGHPRNIKAPTMTKPPSKNRSIGDEPPRGLNSRAASEAANAPKTSPTISGRKYCTTGAVCSLTEPAISRRKQAIQNPMFPGFPKTTSTTAKMPITTPVTIIPTYFFIRFPPFCSFMQ